MSFSVLQAGKVHRTNGAPPESVLIIELLIFILYLPLLAYYELFCIYCVQLPMQRYIII